MLSTRFAFIAAFTLCGTFLNAQIVPEVTINQVFVDETDFSKIHVEYTLQSDASDSVEIRVVHSNDGGVEYATVTNLAGDFGKPVANGPRVLTYESVNAAAQLEDIRVKITARSRFAPSIADMVSQVETSNLFHVISELEGTRNYTVNPTRMESIKDYMETEMSASLDVERLAFSFGTIEAENLISDHQGLIDPTQVVINGAHFDGVAAAPAADDNASGTAGVMEAARVLSQYQFEHSIRFLLFDLEEFGLRGSIDYVNNDLSEDETLLGVLVNEMIAYSDSSANSQQFPAGFNLLFPAAFNEVAADSFRGNFITNVGNTASAPLMSSYVSAAQQYVPILRVIDVEAPGNSQAVPDLRRSDHAPFWDADYQALMITDGANFRNPNYHGASDSLSTLDLTFMKAVVQANIATLATLAVPISAGSDESGYTALLGLQEIGAQSLACTSVSVAQSAGNGMSMFTIESCENILELDVHVTDLAGKSVQIDQINYLDEQHLKLELQSLANTIYIVHGSINGKQFSQRVMRN